MNHLARANTVFHQSTTPLRMTLYSILVFTDLPIGMASSEIQRLLGMSSVGAWEFCDKIRLLLALAEPETKLGGPGRKVYVDEALVRIGALQKRTTLFGMTDGERCAIRLVPNRKAATLLPLICEAVQPGTTIVSDGYQSYKRLGQLGFPHSVVNHRRAPKRQLWVNEEGDSTAHIEGIWGLFKRFLKGKSGGMSDENLWKYVAEVTYRYRAAVDPAKAWWELIGSFRTVRPEDLETVRKRIDRRPDGE